MSLREELAALEHEQWITWSKEVAATESISGPRIRRWSKFWIPYDQLDETTKDFDREWADRVLDVLHQEDLRSDGG